MSRNDKNRNGYDDNYAYQTQKRSNNGGQRGFQDVSSYSASGNVKRKKSGSRKLVQVLLAILFSLFIIVGAGMIYVSTYLLGGLKTTTLTKNPADLGIGSDIIISDEIKNIALFGMDSRGNDFTGQSDAILILSVDMKHGKLKLVSVLRDSYVDIGDGDWNKINAAYAYGGAEEAIRTLNRNFNLDIMDYVTINFGNLAAVVDAVGGVDVNVMEDEIPYINENLDGLAFQQPELGISEADHVTESGYIHLSGHQAVAYSRIRYLDSDFGRVGRQQNVLQAMFGKVSGMNPLQFPELIRQVSSLCETSLGYGDILPLAQAALSGYSLERLTIPRDSEYDFGDRDVGSTVEYDLDAAGQEIDAFIKEQDSPYWSEYFGGSTDETE